MSSYTDYVLVHINNVLAQISGVAVAALILLLILVGAVAYLVWRVEWWLRRRPTIEEQAIDTAAYIHDLGQWAREQMLRGGQ